MAESTNTAPQPSSSAHRRVPSGDFYYMRPDDPASNFLNPSNPRRLPSPPPQNPSNPSQPAQRPILSFLYSINGAILIAGALCLIMGLVWVFVLGRREIGFCSGAIRAALAWYVAMSMVWRLYGPGSAAQANDAGTSNGTGGSDGNGGSGGRAGP